MIYMGFGGARYKIGYNFSYLDCYTPKLFWRPRWDMWKVPKMAESTGTSWYWTLFDPVPYSIRVYWDIWVLGARYKRGYNFSYLDCYTPKLFWRPRWDMWQVPKMAESTGTSWYLTLFDPVPYSICVYWYIWVLGARYKIGYNFSYLDCYTPKLFWWPRWDMWQVPKMAESTGTSWYWTLFDPVPYSIRVYWYIYGFWGAHYKRGSNFSYLDCYTPKLFWRPRWDMWQVPKMAESTGTSWYLTLFDPVPYSIHVYWYIWVFGGPVIKEGIISIVTLQNCFGDLGEMCGKYPRWVKVPGPFDIWTFFTQLPIPFTYIDIYGYWGPVIKEGLIWVISIVTLQQKVGYINKIWVNHSVWVI